MYNGEEMEETTVSAEEQGKEPEEDFLGLGGITAETGSSEKLQGIVAEVLFEGIEMNFDEQVNNITLAELLLAQGKKQEATELYRYVSEHKGTTHWVAKRLALLNPPSLEENIGTDNQSLDSPQ